VKRSPINLKGRVVIALSGVCGQFNITAIVLSALLLTLLFVFSNIENFWVSIIGVSVVLLSTVALLAFAIMFYSKQEARAEPGASASLHIENKAGTSLTLQNPPDKLLMEENGRAFIRSLLVGYDVNLCPDGRVIGKASEQKYEQYTDKEQKEFIEQHRRQIKGIRDQLRHLLEEETPSNSKGVSQPSAPGHSGTASGTAIPET